MSRSTSIERESKVSPLESWGGIVGWSMRVWSQVLARVPVPLLSLTHYQFSTSPLPFLSLSPPSEDSYTSKMTRALQSLSVVLLFSSVRLPQNLTTRANSRSPKLYLALYLGLIPLNETVQREVIPVVRSSPTYCLRLSAN